MALVDRLCLFCLLYLSFRNTKGFIMTSLKTENEGMLWRPKTNDIGMMSAAGSTKVKRMVNSWEIFSDPP